MSAIKILKSKAGYDLAASVYDVKEKYLNSFEKKSLDNILGDLNGKNVLDVGAGTGRLSVKMSRLGAKVTALDLSEEMLKILKNKDRKIEIVQGDAESLPFEDGAFDIVTAVFLIVHLKDPKVFFDEAYRVLKDGGRLIFSNINQKEAPLVKTKNGDIKIESFYHRPDRIIEILEELAYSIEKNEMVYENEVWVNQIVLAIK